MQIVTWNVNSVRARKERLLGWLEANRPDVLCLQELKGEAPSFPLEEVRALGYEAAIYGQKTYNGVAILSRTPLGAVRRGFDDGEPEDPQARLVAATVGGVRVICAYVPNGSEVGSEKYAYKLAWLERLGRYLARHERDDGPLVLCGDFNIAPDDRDVAQPDVWEASVLCAPEVRGALERLLAFGLADLYRLHHTGGGDYSWWDYRMLAFPKNNGLRIDLLLGTESAAKRCTTSRIDRDERKGKQPSDHAPVLVELAD